MEGEGQLFVHNSLVLLYFLLNLANHLNILAAILTSRWVINQIKYCLIDMLQLIDSFSAVFIFNVFLFNVFIFNVFIFNVFIFNVFIFNVFIFTVFIFNLYSLYTATASAQAVIQEAVAKILQFEMNIHSLNAHDKNTYLK